MGSSASTRVQAVLHQQDHEGNNVERTGTETRKARSYCTTPRNGGGRKIHPALRRAKRSAKAALGRQEERLAEIIKKVQKLKKQEARMIKSMKEVQRRRMVYSMTCRMRMDAVATESDEEKHAYSSSASLDSESDAELNPAITAE